MKEYGDKKLFSLIWKEVEKVASVARNIIQARIQDPNHPLDQQERNIVFLKNLGYPKDPTVLYLQTQQDHLVTLMSGIFDKHKVQEEEILNSWLKICNKDEYRVREGQMLTSNLKTMLIEATTNTVEKAASYQLDHKLWGLKVSTLKELLTILSKKLPDFMKIASSAVVMDAKVGSSNLK